MAIIQISRIIQRSGNLVDLPQLAEAELGWANDARRLFVGRGGSYDAENVEVLTSYSSISFGQLEGSYGNLDFSAPKTGQIIAYDSTSNAWVNAGGNATQPANTAQYSNFPIHLGNVDNVKVGGGSLGYVLETDGQGNLSWTPKGSLYTVILDLTNDTGNGNVITMRVPNTTPYTNSQLITITGGNITNSTARNNINGTNFYVKLDDDFSISGNVTLYTDAGLVTSANGAGLLTYVANSGVATAVLSSASGGSGLANGITGAIQYKSTSGFFEGSSQLVWNTGNSSLNISGNATLSGAITSASLSATGVVRGAQIVSTATSPTSPIVVSSSVRIANANVQTAGNLINGTSNVIVNTSGNIAISVAGTTNVMVATSSGISVIGNIQGGNLRTGGVLSVTGNANVGNLGTAGLITAEGTIRGGALSTGGSLGVTGNANVGNLGTAGLITATGAIQTSSTLSAVGNANVGNIGATSGVFTNVSGNGSSLTSITGANVTGTVANATYATSAGTATSATTAGTVTTNAQPNITSVGTLSSLIVSGTANLGNTLTRVITTGANTTTGTITGNWSLTSGSRLQATYADLAEYYASDYSYEPGTVLEFGGIAEVTIATLKTPRVAGVVSTNPSYVMNSNCAGDITVALALQGRVPVKVRGSIKKGDMMVSGGNGYAISSTSPQIGTIIGKALENFEGDIGIIEIAIGRL